MAKTILVTAATGTVGQHLVPRLLALGHRVKAASRSGSSGQHNSVVLDFAKPETFESALAGVDAAYIVIPTGTADPLALAGFINAAAAASVKLIVQTAIGVDASEDIPYRKLERLVEKSGAPYVLLRPNWFFDNFHHYWLKGILDHGLIALPAGDARTSLIDARDIADAAITALTTSEHDGQAFTLTGSESVSYGEAAEILSAVLRRPIRYEAVDTAGFLDFAAKSGLSEGHAQMLASIFYPVAQGWTSADSGETARLTGRPPRRFVDYLADNASRFR
ncbi:SDR family oxidoreductase [Methylosinus sp. PW1]|uniref:SDR family oxidoreductase n=1 Tax=Methylosinus sp. PW1 TaxID=107636 RepID=UPI00056AC05D|nr:SDR family oxidoreductase [Methylosinus sp. PW1]